MLSRSLATHWLGAAANQQRPKLAVLTLLAPRQRNQSAKSADREQRAQHRVLTVPNAVSAARIAAAPGVAACVVAGSYGPAALLTLCAGLSDGLDGWIARRWPSQRSVLGSMLDPLADKLLVGCLSVSLAYAGLLPWQLAAVYLGRDLALVTGSLLLGVDWRRRRRGDGWLASATEVRPLTLSKLNTGLQLCTLGGALCAPLAGAAADASPLQVLWWMSACTTALSGLGYALQGHVTEAQVRLAKMAAEQKQQQPKQGA